MNIVVMRFGCTVQASKQVCLASFIELVGGAGGPSSLVAGSHEVHAMHHLRGVSVDSYNL